MDVYEASTKYVVLLEIGGVSEEKLRIEVDGQTVTIRGCRGDPSGHLEGELQCIHHREIDHGDFERHVFLPGPIDVTGVEATLSDGVLEVSLPKHDPSAIGDARVIEVV
jgi:HSP20 family protein